MKKIFQCVTIILFLAFISCETQMTSSDNTHKEKVDVHKDGTDTNNGAGNPNVGSGGDPD